ncbi:unnamed protein product [Amoebophrya sp. A120]|nr:unnamed protein product [Amoebophrya sp. A120]|eukprot:GSA120T00009532001.1
MASSPKVKTAAPEHNKGGKNDRPSSYADYLSDYDPLLEDVEKGHHGSAAKHARAGGGDSRKKCSPWCIGLLVFLVLALIAGIIVAIYFAVVNSKGDGSLSTEQIYSINPVLTFVNAPDAATQKKVQAALDELEFTLIPQLKQKCYSPVKNKVLAQACLRFETYRGKQGDPTKPAEQKEMVLLHTAYAMNKTWTNPDTNSQEVIANGYKVFKDTWAYKAFDAALKRYAQDKLLDGVDLTQGKKLQHYGGSNWLYQQGAGGDENKKESKNSAAGLAENRRDWKTKAQSSSVKGATAVLAFTGDPAKKDAVKKVIKELEQTHIPALIDSCYDDSKEPGCLYYDAFRRSSKKDDDSGVSQEFVTYVFEEAFATAAAQQAHGKAEAFTNFRTWRDSDEVKGLRIQPLFAFSGSEFGLQNLPSLYTVSNRVQFKHDADPTAVANAVKDFEENIFANIRKTPCVKKMADLRKKQNYSGAKQLCERYDVWKNDAYAVPGVTPAVTTTLFSTMEVYPDRQSFLDAMAADETYQALRDAVNTTHATVIDAASTKIFDPAAALADAPLSGNLARLNQQTDDDFRQQEDSKSLGIDPAKALGEKIPDQTQYASFAKPFGRITSIQFDPAAVTGNKIKDVVSKLESELFPAVVTSCKDTEENCVFLNIFKTTGFSSSTSLGQQGYVIQAFYKDEAKFLTEDMAAPAVKALGEYLLAPEQAPLFQGDAAGKASMTGNFVTLN